MHVKFTDYLMHLFVQNCVETLDVEDNSTYLLHLLFIIYLPVFRAVNLSFPNFPRVLQISTNFLFFFSALLFKGFHF